MSDQTAVWRMVRAQGVSVAVRPSSADWAVVTLWQKLLIGLAVCLPIPALAISGLAVPLPVAVYRAAAAFVGGTEAIASVLTPDPDEAAAPLTLGRDSKGEATSAPAPRRAVGVHAAASGVRPAAGPVRALSPRRSVRAVRSERSSTPRTTETARAASPSASATPPHEGSVLPARPGETRRERSVSEPSGTPSPVVAEPKRQTEPPPLPVSPPPAPPPAVVEPVVTAVEPVTKAVEPVTNAVQPVTKAVEPVTKAVEPVTGALKPVTAALEPVLTAERLGLRP